jgi:MEKHLA domain
MGTQCTACVTPSGQCRCCRLTEDPCLIYGNAAALQLFETQWEDLVGTPSTKTAAPKEDVRRVGGCRLPSLGRLFCRPLGHKKFRPLPLLLLDSRGALGNACGGQETRIL